MGDNKQVCLSCGSNHIRIAAGTGDILGWCGRCAKVWFFEPSGQTAHTPFHRPFWRESIRTAADYEAALLRMDQIIDAWDGTPEGDELVAIAMQVAAYESTLFPVRQLH